MKTLIVGLAILSSVAVQAQSVVVGGWGTDGMSGMSIPKMNSADEARAVYEALNLPKNEFGKKIIAFENAEFSCSEPIMGITRLSANCEITAMVGPSFAQIDGNDLLISEHLAEAIFKAMHKPAPERMGVTNKKAGNISCTQIVGIRTSYNCKFKEIVVNKMQL